MADLSHLSRVLVVEDEGLIALDVETTLRDAGVRDIVSAANVADALALIARVPLDAAILDLHLGRGGWSHVVAEQLRAKGVPFIFSSGTVAVVDGFRDVPFVAKPFATDQLLAALLQVTAQEALEAAQ
jgi:DNA-binding NtrC family response regulator